MRTLAPGARELHGADDILILLVYGIKGFHTGITLLSPHPLVQTCGLPLTRNSLVSHVVKDRQAIPQTHSHEMALARLEEFEA